MELSAVPGARGPVRIAGLSTVWISDEDDGNREDPFVPNMILGRRGALRALRITSGSPARTGIAGALSGAAHTVGHAAAGQVLPRGLYVKHTSDADLAHATPIKTGVPGVVVKPVG